MNMHFQTYSDTQCAAVITQRLFKRLPPQNCEKAP